MRAAVLDRADRRQLVLGPPPAALQELILDSPRFSFIVLAVVVAPLTEEPLFRGVIMHGFLQRYGPVRAIWLSAVLFAVFHGLPWQWTGAFICGACLGWLMVRTGSLWPCLIGHAFFNLASVVAPLLPPIPGYSTAPQATVEFQPVMFDLVGLGTGIAGFWWLRRVTPTAAIVV